MLQLSSFVLNRPVLSIRSGDVVATTTTPIVNPDNLKIEGFNCVSPHGQLILLCQDIREISADGLIIDDFERLVEANDLVRLKKIIELDYRVIGKAVETVDKHRLGKVNDYAIDTNSMYIQKIYVSQSMLKSLAGNSLSIDRSQIHETTPKKIIISELSPKDALTAPATIS